MVATMTARAVGLLRGDPSRACEALRALATFAARNPGIEAGNYGWGRDGYRAYRSEARRVSRDLDEVRALIGDALAWGVTDADVIEAARGDRLQLERGADGEQAVPLRSGGKLGDIAPTLLDLWGLAKPGVMSGESLVEGVRG